MLRPYVVGTGCNLSFLGPDAVGATHASPLRRRLFMTIRCHLTPPLRCCVPGWSMLLETSTMPLSK
jgi:hypothetical protein